MTPVYQTTVNNCLTAAVASLLDLPLEAVPDWWPLTGSSWLKAIVDWADSRGLGVCYFDLKNRKDWPILANHHVIVAGDTSRSNEYFHAVIAHAIWDETSGTTRLDFIHDPYKRGDFISQPDHCLFFVRR